MSYDWHKFLHAGQHFAGFDPDEPLTEDTELRIAVIMLYYSVFRLARNYLRDYQGYNVTYGYGNHSDVFYALDQLKGGQFTTLVGILRQLKKWRESANYDEVYKYGYLPDRITYILKNAEQAVDIIDRLTKP